LSSVITSADYQRLIEIGLALSAEKEINSLLERVLREAKAVGNADAGTLYLKNSDETLSFVIILNDTLNIFQGGTSEGPVALPNVPLLTESGDQNMANIVSRATLLGETLIVDDAYATDEFDFSGTRLFDEMTGYHSTSFLTIPMKAHSEKVIGVLQLLNAKSPKGEVIAFSSHVRSLIEALCSQASVAMENRYLLDEQEQLKKQLEDEVDVRTAELKKALDELSRAHTVLKEITTIDPVTGIRNRQYFDEIFDQEWRRAQRQQYSLSMLLVDIDHFKKVNDTYGHLAGDECLAGVAGAIDVMLNRPSDVVARYGGEEFVVVMPYASSENAEHLADFVRDGVAKRVFNAAGENISVTISIGVSSVVPDEQGRPRDLISQADDALYQAKAKGRNQVCVYGVD